MYDDELQFKYVKSTIEKVQISNEPNRNFLLVESDSIIYKYDLVSKELLLKWKTQPSIQIELFYKDDRLLTISTDSVKVWDFDDAFEAPPTIWATEEFGKDT